MKVIITSLFLLACVSCSEQAQKQDIPKKEPVMVKDTAIPELRKLAFASSKDLVCGMPVTAGVHDTLTFKGRLYGFCASECKDEFIKNPEQYLTVKK